MRLVSTSTEVQCHLWQDSTLQGYYKSANSQNTHINTVSWAKDGGWLVIVPDEGYAEVVSFNDTAKLLLTIQEVQHPTCASFQNSTKRNVALGTASGQLMIYDIKNKSIKRKYPYGPSAFFKIQFMHKDGYIIAGCENGEICIYNNNSVNLSASFKMPDSSTVTNFKCHPSKRNYIACCSEEGIVSLWDINQTRTVAYLDVHRAAVNDLTFAPGNNKDVIVSIGLDRQLCFYDVRANKIVHDINIGPTPTAIDSSFDGNEIAVGCHDGQILSFDVRNLQNRIYKFSHGSKIKQIMFEKINLKNASVINLPEEIQETIVLEPKPHSDSFGHMFTGQILPEIPEEPQKEIVERDDLVKDSFFDAIGFNSVNLSGSRRLSISDGVKKLMDSKPNLFEASPKVAGRKSLEPSQRGMFVENTSSKSQLASTPLPASVEERPMFFVSPIPCANSNDRENAAVDIRAVIKEVLKEEMEDFKKEIRYQMMDMMAATRRHFLDLQMLVVKEFVNVEENFDRFRDEIAVIEETLPGYDK